VHLERGEGFTLVEVMAGLAVLAIVMVALASLSVGTIRANRIARNVTAATNLARDKIEELRGKDYWTLTTGSDLQPLTEAGATGGSGAIFTRSWYVWAGPTDSTLYLKVVVSWRDTATREVSVRSVLGS
jgi:prepilin-type N-terminal cleavage/methylation domain-containing protein